MKPATFYSAHQFDIQEDPDGAYVHRSDFEAIKKEWLQQDQMIAERDIAVMRAVEELGFDSDGDIDLISCCKEVRARLATARDEALEEAAVIARSLAMGTQQMVDIATIISDAIRAAKSKKEKT